MQGVQKGDQQGAHGRCKGVTRSGVVCRRRAVRDGYCRQHDVTLFYARALDPDDRATYEAALLQEGLGAEVAILRLHLLRLVGRDDAEQPGEIPRAVHALVRALKEQRGASGMGAELDALIQAEGLHLLDGSAPSDGSVQE